MDQNDYDYLCVISYLIKYTEKGKIIGISELAERLYYLTELVHDEKDDINHFSVDLPEYVVRTDSNSLDWNQLREFIDEIEDSKRAQLFVALGPEQIEPEEWNYTFYSRAPETALNDQIKSITEHDNRFKRLINEAASLSEEKLISEVYSN